MSAWRILLQSLADAGGGPIEAAKLRAPWPGMPSAIRDASAIGAIKRIGPKAQAKWVLTELGLGYMSGELVAVYGAGRKLELVPYIPELTDEIIEQIMIDAGHEVGDAVTPATLRRYSHALWGLAKHSVSERKK